MSLAPMWDRFHKVAPLVPMSGPPGVPENFAVRILATLERWSPTFSATAAPRSACGPRRVPGDEVWLTESS